MRRSRSRSAFTLLEVLAAVAILGIWYVILATVGIQGLSAQGESHRRLQASFIADDVLAEIEAGLTGGQAPPEGIEEYDRDEYQVRVEVMSYEFDVPPLEVDASTLDGSSLEQSPGAIVNLLGGGGIAEPSPLRSIRVSVTWPEGHNEKTVIRDTYAFDLESVRDELESLESLIATQTQDAERDGDEAVPDDIDLDPETRAELEAAIRAQQ